MREDVGSTEADQEEYREAHDREVTETEPVLVDDQGRQAVQTMTDREILEETLVYLRAFGDALAVASKSPMAMAIPGIRDLLGK